MTLQEQLRKLTTGGPGVTHIASETLFEDCAQKLDDDWKDSQALMKLLADEKHKVAALEARCRELEARNDKMDEAAGAFDIKIYERDKRIAELEAALRRLKGETFCSRDWYAAFGACLELVRDGVTASETTVNECGCGTVKEGK